MRGGSGVRGVSQWASEAWGDSEGAGSQGAGFGVAGRLLPPHKIPSRPRSAPSPTCALSLSLSPVISSNINSFSSRASRLSFRRSSSCWILAPSSSLSAQGEVHGGHEYGVLF